MRGDVVAGQLAPFSTLASLASFLGKGTDTLLLRRRPSDTHGAVESERRHSWTRRRDDSRAEERPDRTGTLLHRLRSTALNLPAPHPVLARSCFNSAPMHRYSCRRGRLRVAQTHPRSRRPPPGARRQLSRTRPICFRHSTPGARSCCRPPSQRTRSRTADGSLEPLLAIIFRPSSSRCSSRCYHAALGGARRRLLSSAPL